MSVVYRMKDLIEMGFSRSFLYSMRRHKKFPHPIETGTRTKIWRKSDIHEFLGISPESTQSPHLDSISRI